MTESIYMTGIIDARENQAVAVLNVGNAFLHADNDKRVLVLLHRKLAEMMCIDSSMYRKCTTYSHKGVSMIYVRLSKVLYGMLRAALLFYNKLRSDL